MTMLTKRERTKQLILDSAWHLFEQQGYELTTTREIAKAANVSDGTVFSHFPTKVDLLRSGMEQKIAAIFSTALEQKTNPTLDDLLRLCKAYYDYYFCYPELSQVLLSDALWQLDKFAHLETEIRQCFIASENSITPQQADIIFDCYLMTLISHLPNPESSASEAFQVLKSKLCYVLGSDEVFFE